jgi:paraquat-inducible protein A
LPALFHGLGDFAHRCRRAGSRAGPDGYVPDDRGPFFPFLGIRIGDTSNDTSVLGAVLAFADDRLFPVAVFMTALIIMAPLLRVLALIYALLPLVARRRPFAHAASALRLAAALKPWSMTEVFIVGVAVSMVKISGIASISFGPAFWAFTFLVIVTVGKDSEM